MDIIRAINYDEMKFERSLPMGEWTSLLIGIVGYLVTIFALKEWMYSRKKFDLKWVVFLHNAFLCALSLAMLLGSVYELGKIILAYQGDLKELLFCDSNRRLVSGGHIFWFYIFYLSKFYEFFDTIIIVLKRRPLIFLHVYHHFITAVLVYVMLDNSVTVQWIAICANAAVHVPMYFYYACAVLGYSPWWKKFITVFQIIQFVTDISANAVGFYYHYTTNHSCSGSIESWWFGQGILISFLILFINFFSKTYKPKGTEKQE